MNSISLWRHNGKRKSFLWVIFKERKKIITKRFMSSSLLTRDPVYGKFNKKLDPIFELF
jgi:hypothetical protein